MRGCERESLVHRQRTAQHVARRGRMILAAGSGKKNTHIARELGVSVDAARSWRMRWMGLLAVSLDELTVNERLSDVQAQDDLWRSRQSKPGRLVALACEQPN